MKNNFLSIHIGNRNCFIYLPKEYSREPDKKIENSEKKYPVLYLHDGEEVEQILLRKILKNNEFSLSYIIVGIYSNNRMDEYTPWYETTLKKGYKNFGGGADTYITEVIQSIKPYIDKNFRTKPSREYSAIGGYSLGGLVSLYSSFITETFKINLSISGSLWYPKFLDYVENKALKNKNSIFYISIGKKEGITSNDIRNTVIENSDRIFKSLSFKTKTKTKNNSFSMDEYNHHENKENRYLKAFIWLENILKNR